MRGFLRYRRGCWKKILEFKVFMGDSIVTQRDMV